MNMKTKAKKAGLTTAEFIREKIREKKLTDEQILAAARKRAPKQKIADSYVSFYRWSIKNRPVKRAA
jgi:hypothetical protein